MNSKPITKEFKAFRKDKHGKPLKNEAGDIIYDTYCYSYARMSMARILMARTFFQLHEKQLLNTPREPDHIEILADRQSELYGYMTILAKKLEDGTFEEYNPTMIDVSIMDRIEAGAEEENLFDALMECKSDFFTKAGLASLALNGQSAILMQQSVNIVKELAGIAGNGGQASWEGMKELLSMVINGAASLPSETEPEPTI